VSGTTEGVGFGYLVIRLCDYLVGLWKLRKGGQLSLVRGEMRGMRK
jgi:hypothetical protein